MTSWKNSWIPVNTSFFFWSSTTAPSRPKGIFGRLCKQPLAGCTSTVSSEQLPQTRSGIPFGRILRIWEQAETRFLYLREIRKGASLLQAGDVGINHHLANRFKTDLGFPSQNLLGFGVITHQGSGLGRSDDSFVNLNMILPVKTDIIVGFLAELLDGMGLAGGNDKIVGFILLQHQPHGYDEIAGIAPIPFCVQGAHRNFP